LYLVPALDPGEDGHVIDCFDGMVVSWSIGTRPNAELVNTMLDAAVEKITASGDRPVVHSDRGGHYRWPGWLSRIAEAKLVRSMSRNPHAAMVYLKEVLQTNPANSRALYLLAVQHAELGLHARATKEMLAALDLEPTLEIARF
jgi:transposase InsO family protein